ncbi:hypothetical protein Tco_1264132 [Tanacetum coccineum]
MACSVPHTYDEIKSMVEKQIQEDRGRLDIPLVQRALIENFLKIESELDQQMQNALFRKAAKLEKQIRDKYENLAFRHIDSNLNIISLTPVASSEGVWCFAFCDNSMLLLWNPSIKKSVGISVSNYTFQPDSPKMIFGFVSTLSSRTWYNLDYDCLPRESIRIIRADQSVIDGKIFWIGSERFYNDDGIAYKIYLIVLFDLVTHQFHVQDMPEQVRVGEFSPPYYISQLGDSVIIFGSFDFKNFHIIYAWALEVEGGFVSSCSLLFIIPYPGGHYLKLLGFSKNNQPSVEAKSVHQWYRLRQVFHPTIQYFQNIGVEANRDSFFISLFKESLILLTEPNNELIY